MTKFATVYNRFLGKVTDDMYVELTPEDTLRDLQNLLIDSIPCFEYPRKNLYDYKISKDTVFSDEVTDEDFVTTKDETTVTIDTSEFAEDLTSEEINILAYLMLDRWLQRQITSIENTRMKYSGSDFKFTSQANHLQKLLTAQEKTYQRSFHLQRLYKRREQNPDDNNRYRSTWYLFGKKSALDGQ